MRNGFLGSMTALLAGTGLAMAQTPMLSSRSGVPMTPALLAAGQPMASVQPAQTLPSTSGTGTASSASVLGMPVICSPCAEPTGCGCSDGCDVGLIGRYYAGADYILMWTKGHKLPSLVTTGAVIDLSTTGALGKPGTVVLFGNSEVDDDVHSAGRITAGFWINPERSVGLEASLLYMDPQSTTFQDSSNSSRVLARPFTNSDLISANVTSLGASPESSLLIAFPGIASPGGPVNQLMGSVSVVTHNELWGIETNARLNVAGNSWYRADALVGFRFAEIKDELTIASSSMTTPGSGPTTITFNGLPVPSPFTVNVTDGFRTRNEYYGGQLGTNIEARRGRLFADFTAKVALGIMHQTVTIDGQTTVTSNAFGRQVAVGGLLATTTNRGVFNRDEFGVVPEVGINVGYQFGRHLRASVGYSVLYFRSDVVRPGSEIDPILNPRFVPALASISQNPPGPVVARPAFFFHDVDFWAQGLNARIEFSF